MKLRAFLSIITLACLSIAAKAQVKLISMPELQKRISNPDTLYVVNFWATWCGSCVKELPDFDKLQRTYKNKPVKVLLVSMDFQSKLKTAVIPFVKRNKLYADVLLATRKNDQEMIDAVDKTWSGALPATLIVSNKKHLRKFYEKEFTYAELDKIYQTKKL